MKRITILSGKGGTGKSTISSSLAVLLSKNKKIIAVDCDVDAPNLGLCLGIENNDYQWKSVETGYKAILIEEKCIHCGQCHDICKFGAISWNEKKNQPIFNRLLCEGCGACKLICPVQAIELIKVKNGRIGHAKTAYGFNIVTGQLEMGESGSGQIVLFIKTKAEHLAHEESADILLVDSAAGIGCPVIASINGSDYVIAVTEPTPSALSDLKKGLQVVEYFKIPYGLVINKFDINEKFSKKIEQFANENDIPLLGKIPYDEEFVNALINLTPAVVWNKKFESVFQEIIKNTSLME
ncbi:ATP-binding protein [Candidatus Parcubacteria bacterium]|nr:ATP-binding protein [Candidatus Parcubacteria bacterium]